MNDQILLKSQISFPQQSADCSPQILQELRALKKEVQTKIRDSWMDAKSAARYMGISESSFDKYRYKTNPRLKGYNLDGNGAMPNAI